jgi:hypothetical protein
MIKKSEGWIVLLIWLMATSSFTLWDSRNQSRHGSDAATNAQLLKEQNQRELQCLYLLRDQVLIQDQSIFRPTIQQHVEESVPQQRSWLTHYKKLIVHSVKVAKAQAQLKTHQIQRYFQGHRVLTSKVSQSTSHHPPPRRHRLTRMSNFFATRNISTSSIRVPVNPIPLRRRSSYLMTYFQTTGVSRSVLPTISEDREATTTAIERRQLQRRLLNMPNLDIFPDHPG